MESDNQATSTMPGSIDAELHDFLRKTFISKTRDEWVNAFSDLNICVCPVNSVEEALLHPLTTSREMVVELVHPKTGKYKQIGTPLKSKRQLADPGHLPAPQLGEHTSEILLELGYSEMEIDSLIKSQIIRDPKNYEERKG
jgi:crotonobetainyl-CoA:carnitine CoA-transferase CaiB-like acyl-CoA transferase